MFNNDSQCMLQYGGTLKGNPPISICIMNGYVIVCHFQYTSIILNNYKLVIELFGNMI